MHLGPLFGFFFKSKSDIDLLLEASWTLFGPFWETFGQMFGELFGNMFGKSFWHRFLMLFRCFQILKIRFSPVRKRNFNIFVSSLLASTFASQTFQNRPQNGPKKVPTWSHMFLKKFLLKRCFSEGSTVRKGNFRKFRRSLLSQHGPKRDPKRPPKAVK